MFARFAATGQSHIGRGVQTRGAGFIGNNMVHALVDAGERVVVLDNLATGFDWAIAQGASLVIDDVGEQPLSISPLRPSSGFGSRSARLLPQQCQIARITKTVAVRSNAMFRLPHRALSPSRIRRQP
jgi:hypothetical protein